MKTLTHAKQTIINVRGLIVIYLALCIITVLFSRFFFIRILQGLETPLLFYGLLFFTIPAVLAAFLSISLLSFLRDLIARRSGGRFQIKLLGYFSIIALFAATPAAIITAQAAAEFVRFYRSIDVLRVIDFAEESAISLYAFQLEHFETLAAEVFPGASDLPEEIAGVQEFAQNDAGEWEAQGFWGDSSRKVLTPPAVQTGFLPREMPRDTDTVRYALRRGKKLWVFWFNLAEGFDGSLKALEQEKSRFSALAFLNIHVKPILIFYYSIFFFPIILMTLIIAISFTRRITQPLMELTEATRRIASGDFSVHIMTRKNDELSQLVGSFNTMAQDLGRLKTSLVKAEKISIWQSMAEQLAHEIKNPLTPIKLSAERVLRRWRNEPDRLGEILETSMLAIIQETEMLTILLTEFRTLSKPLEPSRTWTNVRDLAESVIGPYGSSHPRVNINIASIPKNISVKIDPHRLGQALVNLINNGIDAMDGAGLIEIRADLVKKREIRYCRISVRDTGKGIPEADKSRIFTPYFTTKAGGTGLGGTGLGLPIVERIVQDHGGSIWVNSAEAAGSTFFIDLPGQEDAEPQNLSET
ncbi:MAG: HAMP domain-containing protein [Spirochaetaceae bacterium]|nr:HAMP domain-containing protein [Spirochaetaceae bacterium]